MPIKKRIPPREENGLRLRLLRKTDLPKTRAWRNIDEVRQWFNFTDVITPRMHQEWWEKYRRMGSDYVFIIELPNGTAVGQVAVYNIDHAKKTGEYGRCIVCPQQAGKNILFRASLMLFGLIRDSLGLECLHLQVKNNNAKAKCIYERLGFVVSRTEGALVFMDRPLM